MPDTGKTAAAREDATRPKRETMSTFPIRHAEPGDAAALHAILTSDHVVAGTMRLPHAALATTEARLAPQPDRVQLVALLDGEVAGFAEVLTQFGNPRACHAAVLNMIVTREDRCRSGVGTALLEAVLDLADNHWGLRRLGLTVWADNDTAIRLYQRFGFVEEGKHGAYVRAGPGFKDALTMARLR